MAPEDSLEKEENWRLEPNEKKSKVCLDEIEEEHKRLKASIEQRMYWQL